MQSDPNFHSSVGMDGYGLSADMDDYYSYYGASSNATPAGGWNGYPGPSDGVELQPSNTCPKNFVIFDQTGNTSSVMFHPTLAHKNCYQHFDVSAIHPQYHGGQHIRYTGNQDKPLSSLKEDSDDIDALLSLEEGEEDNEEDDVASTGRTPGYYRSNSPDSMSSSADDSIRKTMSHLQSSTSNAVSARKKDRMKKMVRALKGIVPGGDQMDTPAVLDEAVRYLKSLKVKAEKLGIRNLKN